MQEQEVALEPGVYEEARDLGTPGLSAKREFERRRARERASSRRGLPLKITFVVIAAIGGYVALQIVAAIVNGATKSHLAAHAKPPWPPSLAHGLGLLFGFVAAVGMARSIWGRRQTTEAWGIGGKGEEAVGSTLAQLASKGVISIHDRKIPGSRANIDHIAVAASGIYVIDAKVVSGKMSSRRTGPIWDRGPMQLLIGGRNKSSFISGMDRQVETVTRAVNGVGGGVSVEAMVVLVGVQVGWFERPLLVQGVWIGWRKALGKVLTKPGAISPEIRQHLATAIADRLPAA
jgi:hypothetical protein